MKSMNQRKSGPLAILMAVFLLAGCGKSSKSTAPAPINETQATDAANRATELPAPLRALYTAIRTSCPTTIEDQRHDVLITRCLQQFHAGALPIA